MKRLGVCSALLLALLVSARTAAGATELEHLQRFEQANRLFAEANDAVDYLAVAALFQSILDDGVKSGAVLFNQGNAYAQAGEEGRAIACYRQAERLRPRDPVLDSNLAFVLASVGAAEPRRSVLDHVLFWRDWMSYREKALAVALLAFAVFFAGLLALWSGRAWRRLALVLIAGLVLIGVSLALDISDIHFTAHGVVVSAEATARMGNSESFAPAFNEPLTEGAEFIALERRDGWARIRIGSDLEGWIQDSEAVFY